MSEQLADEDSQSNYSEDYETDQTMLDSSTLHPIPGTQARNKTRVRIRKSKSERFYIDKQKIIESISPVLLKKVLKNILDFLLNKEEASIIFSNLAPVEARFLENFPGIYKKRQSFEETLTPACNVILNKMCHFFKEFDKQCKLEVYAGNYNANTTKREVKFMKVPRYTSKPQTNHVTVKNTTTENVQKINRNIPNADFSENTKNNSLKVTISNGNTESFGNRQNREVKPSNETKKTDSSEKRKTKMSSITEAKDNRILYNNFDKVKLTTNAKAIDNRLIDYATDTGATDNVHSENTDNKAVLMSSSAKNKNNQIIQNGDIVGDKRIAKEKELSKKETDEILKKTVLPAKKQIEQAENPIRNNDKVGEGSPQTAEGSRKAKLLQAMSTPLQSYKGSRMMRLMGWEGGALGPRGDGITEPIIPSLHIVSGKGLGHVSEKPKPKPVRQEKTDIRVQFLKSILNVLTGDSNTAWVNYKVLNPKEERCFKHIINHLNLRKHIVLTAAEESLMTEIERIMGTHANMTLNLSVSYDSKILIVTKCLDDNMETNAEIKRKGKVTKKVNDQMSLKDMKLYFCHSVLEFVKSENITTELFFSGALSQRFFNFIKSVCDSINNRVMVPSALVSEVSMEILECAKDCFLDAQIDFKVKRSVLLSKLYFDKPRINTEVVKSAILKYTDSNIPDINNTDDIMSEHRDKKTNNNYKETVNENAEVDSANKVKSRKNTARQMSPSNKIKKKFRGADSLKDIIYNFNHNANVNDSILNDYNETNKRNTQLIEEVARLPLNANDFKRNNITSDNNNFKTIDRDLIQLTINSLTSQNNWEEVKIKLHNEELHTKHRHNGNLFTDKQSKLEINNNSRKWYERSDYFLNSDDLVKNAPVNNLDHNNEIHRVNDCKSDYREIDKEIEEKIAYMEINTTTNKAENYIKTETYYKKDGEIESSSHSTLNVKQVEGLRKAISDNSDINISIMTHKSDVIFDESQETLKINSISDLIETDSTIKEDLMHTVKDCVEECKETNVNSYLNMIPVETDHNRDMNETDIKNKLIIESSKYCHDIIIIETNIIATAEVHKRVQSALENMDYDNGFLPLYKYHGVVEKGVVYTCHNKDTCLWLKSVLDEYTVIDYRSSINVHKVKISITSFNSDTRKFFELLEVYNKGLNCCDWKVTSQNYLHYLLIIVVEMDDDSFEYICDNNFALTVGYGVAQFSIGL